MKCQQCHNELFIDHIERSEDGQIETYVYVCLNPQCNEYRRAFTAMGKPMQPEIKKGA